MFCLKLTINWSIGYEILCPAKIVSFLLNLIVNWLKYGNSKQMFLKGINSVSILTRQIKLLHNFSLYRFIFKAEWRFFGIPIGCFTVFLSSLVMWIIPKHLTSEAIVGDQFQKRKSLTWFISLVLWESLGKFQDNLTYFCILLICSKREHLHKT